MIEISGKVLDAPENLNLMDNIYLLVKVFCKKEGFFFFFLKNSSSNNT